MKDVEPTIDYLYEPSPDQILRDLIPKHLEFQIYRILLDSAAAEYRRAPDAPPRPARAVLYRNGLIRISPESGKWEPTARGRAFGL